MDRWTRVDGVRWLHRPAAREAPGAVTVVLGRGYGHQRVDRLGSLDAAVALVSRTLRRPVETPDGVQQLAVEVEVNLFDTVLLLRGAPGVLRCALESLDALLRDPGPAVLDPTTGPGLDHPFAGWGRELAAWFGAGPASLSTELRAQEAGTPEALAEALGSLHPSRGTPVVVATSDAELIGCALGADLTPAALVAAAWRDCGPGSVVPTFHNNVLSARSALSLAGVAAEQTLLTTLHRSLQLSTGSTLRVRAGSAGEQRLLAVRVSAREGEDMLPVHQAVLAAVGACAGLPSETFEEQAARMASPEVLEVIAGPVALARRALHTGEELSRERLTDQVAGLTAPGLREELATLCRNLLVGLPGGDASAGFPLLPATAIDTTAGARTSRRAGRRARHRTKVAMPVDGRWSHALVARDGDALSVSSVRGGRDWRPLATRTVDLARLVARVDRSSSTTLLVDGDDRRVQLTWPALARRARLEAVVAAAVRPGAHLRLTPDAALDVSVDRELRRRRGVLAGVAAFLVLVAGGIAAAQPWRDADQPLVSESVAPGATVALANGSTLTVSDVRRAEVSGVSSDVLLATVRFCGGGPTVDESTSDDARNYISPDKFDLEGTPRNPLRTRPPGTAWLEPTQLAAGDCATGAVGFEVPPELPAVGLWVRYSNLMGDQVRWSI